MSKKLPKLRWILLGCLMLAPVSLWALEFKMPKDAAEEESSNALEDEKDYGDTKNPLDGFGRPAREVPKFVVTDETTEIEEATDSETDDDFIDIPLLEAEAEPEPETEVAEEELAEGEGRIIGQVFDKETGAPVRGVAIAVEGTDFGTITDEDGNFKLNAIPEGSYTLAYFKTGYLEANITDVKVESGEIKTLDFALPPRPTETSDDVYDLGTITVTAEEANDLMMKLELQKLSITQLDVLSAEEFSKYAASDIADAVKNIAGVSLSDGKYAVIRGLNDRYSVTRLNKNTMPSPDPDRAAVPLDVFPTGIFESIETRKTNSPDLPGEASGGAIDLRLLSMPEERVLRFSFGGGFNTESQDYWLTTDRGSDRDFLGNGASYRDFDSDFGSAQRFLLPGEIADFQEAASNTLSAFESLLPKNDNPKPDYKFSVLYGDTFDLSEKDKLGLVFAVQQKSESRSINDMAINGLGESETADADSVFGRGDYIVNQWDGVRDIGTFEGQLSALAGISYEYEDIFYLSWNVLFSRTGVEEVIDNQGGFIYGSGGQNSSLTFEEVYDPVTETADTSLITATSGDFLRSSYTEKTLGAGQLSGEFNPDFLEMLSVSWSLLYTDNEQDEPDNVDTRGRFAGTPVRISRLTNQDSYGLMVSSRLELDEVISEFNDQQADIELGISLDHSEREFEQQQKEYAVSNSVEVEGSDRFIVLNLSEVDSGVTGKADGERNIDAFYAMLDTRPVNWAQVVLGARVEESEISYDGFGSAPQAGDYNPELVQASPIDQIDWIPSVNINLELPHDLKLRLAYSETIARPTYRELQPFPILNTLTNEIEVGNPGQMAQVSALNSNPVLRDSSYHGLEIAEVKNSDIRLEWYPNEESFYAIGFFLKEVGNPIERIEAFGQASTLPVFTFVNNENTADLFGFEIECQQNIGTLFGQNFLEFLSVGGNFTYIDATVDRSAAELENPTIQGVATDQASSDRPLYDQPDIIGNLFIGMEFENVGAEFTLSLNHTGERLTGALSSVAQDIYEDAVTTMNLVYTQQIPWVKGLRLSFSAKNVTNPTFRRITKQGDNNILLRDETGSVKDEISLNEFKRGTSFSATVNYEF